MPLILFTGYPSSGKTTVAKNLLQELKDTLKERKLTTHVRIISDTDQLDWEGRDVIYNSIPKEKELRGWIRAEAQRYVNLNQIVILDVAAYIKGFRYELYCMTKEAQTQYCVVEILAPIEVCWDWNVALKNQTHNAGDDESPESGYNKQTFDGLVMRYEKCDATNRWDSPLFRIDPTKDNLNYDEIFKCVTEAEPLIPNKSTSLTQTTSTIYSQNKERFSNLDKDQ